jgi:hypothetical protein
MGERFTKADGSAAEILKAKGLEELHECLGVGLHLRFLHDLPSCVDNAHVSMSQGAADSGRGNTPHVARDHRPQRLQRRGEHWAIFTR